MPPAHIVVHTVTGALGRLSLLWVLLLVPAWGTAADCAIPDGGVKTTVDRVIDGDTVVLGDGERVRIIGLDTPEFGRRGRADEPYAREAATHLRTLVELAGGEVTVVPGEEPRDRYGRMLARVFTPRHGDLAAHLVEHGMGFAVAIAPNTDGADCHFAAEGRARKAGRGLWSDPAAVVMRAAELDDTGFAIILGEVTEVRRRRDDTLLTLDDALVIRILRGGFDHDPRALQGRAIEVRGWVHPWHGDARAVTVSHPAMITVVPGHDI